MAVYLISLSAGILVGVIYGLINVRSPAPPVVALVGLLGILIGEQLVPLAKRAIQGEPVSVSWLRQDCVPRITGVAPEAGRQDGRTNPPSACVKQRGRSLPSSETTDRVFTAPSRLFQPVQEASMSNPKTELLTAQNCQLIIIDHQPQMAFGVQSMDRQALKNNVVGLAKGAKAFNVPTIITTVETESFSGYTYPELLDIFPEHKLLERSSMNSWDDKKVRDALQANGRKKVVVAGLWTEVCNNSFALEAMDQGGYEIYMVADASGGTSREAHDYAMQRMIQAGVVPVTWQQVLLEWQRDWARRDTYDAVMEIVKEHSGAYGMGVDYAYTMVHKAPQRTARKHEVLAPVAAVNS
jgi:XapX domain-containing protein